MQSPNILITNFCNQSCSFCFARAEMSSKIIDREMKVSDFEKILTKITKSSPNVDSIKLLGGEPTLHSQFKKIIERSLEKFSSVHIFTNGMLPDKKAEFLKRHFPRLKFTFNVMTPSFLLNQKVRQSVLDRIYDFAPLTEVTLSMTIDMHTDILQTLKTISDRALQSVYSLRIGFANPTAGDKNWYKFEEFPKMGNQLYRLVSYVQSIGSKAKFALNCGLTRCMFTDEEYDFLKKNGVEILGWGCFGKSSPYDVATNMTAFHCFPLSTEHRLPVGDTDPVKLNSKFLAKRYSYWQNIFLKVCQSCPFYGHTPDKCPGPCIAFRLNRVANAGLHP